MSDRTRGSSDLDEADIELLRRLGAIAEVLDPVPDHVRQTSRALFSLRDPDVELMRAVEVDADRLESVRGTSPTSRMHFFEFGALSVDVELTVSGGFCDVVGVIADPAGSMSGLGDHRHDGRVVHDRTRRRRPVRAAAHPHGDVPSVAGAGFSAEGVHALVRGRLTLRRPRP